MKRKLIAFAAGITVMLAACTKEQYKATGAPRAVQSKAPVVQTYFNDPAANAANPYDSLGMIHNLALQWAWDSIQETGDTSRAFKTAQIAVFNKLRYGIDIRAELTAMDEHFQKTFPQSPVQQIPSKYFTPALTDYLNQLLAQMNGLKDAQDYDHLKAGLIKLETAAARDRRLTTKEQNKFLMVAAIARYSTAFWLQKIDLQPKNVTGTISTTGFFHNLIKAIVCATQDVIGAVDAISYMEPPSEVLEEAELQSACAAWAMDM